MEKTSRQGLRPNFLAQWHAYLEPHKLTLLSLTPQESPKTIQTQCQECGAREEVLINNLLRRRLRLKYCCGTRRRYTAERVRRTIEAHGGELLEGSVTHGESRVRVRCACGTITTKTAKDVHRSPGGCKACISVKMSATQRAQNDNLRKAHAVARERGGQCLIPETGKPISQSEKIPWQCGVGHTWKAGLVSVLRLGTWCKKCATSVGESIVRTLLETAFQRAFPKKKPGFLGGLELDGYCEELQLAFEHQGIQHYQRSPAYHKAEAHFERQLERDALKMLRCQQAGVRLLVVPYVFTEKGLLEQKRLRAFLDRSLKTLSLRPPNDILSVKIDNQQIFDPRLDPRYLAFEEAVRRRGGHFDSTQYQRVSFRLPVTCAHGHTWKASPQLILKGHWCPGPCCAGVLPKSIEDIREALSTEGWTLEKEVESYSNAHQALRLRCPSGHLVKRTWNAWQQGKKSCRRCKVEQEGRGFIERMRARGIEMALESKDYQNGDQQLSGRCRVCQQTDTKTAYQWKTARNCPACSRPLEPYHPFMRRRIAASQRKQGQQLTLI